MMINLTRRSKLRCSFPLETIAFVNETRAGNAVVTLKVKDSDGKFAMVFAIESYDDVVTQITYARKALSPIVSMKS